jgi:hypothetical protein
MVSRTHQHGRCTIFLLPLQQAQGLGGVALKYNGMWDVLSKTVRHEGFFGLYKARLCWTLSAVPTTMSVHAASMQRRLVCGAMPWRQIHHTKASFRE